MIFDIYTHAHANWRRLLENTNYTVTAVIYERLEIKMLL